MRCSGSLKQKQANLKKMRKMWGKRSSNFYWNINLVAEKLISKKKWNRRKRKKAERNEIKEEATIWERVFSVANESKRNNRTTTTNEIKAAYISLKKAYFSFYSGFKFFVYFITVMVFFLLLVVFFTPFQHSFFLYCISSALDLVSIKNKTKRIALVLTTKQPKFELTIKPR